MFQEMQRQARAAIVQANGIADPKAFLQQQQRLKETIKTINTAVAAQDDFSVSTVKVKSSSDAWVKSLKNGQVGILDVVKNMGALNKAYQDQLRLQQTMVAGVSKDAMGGVSATMVVPKNYSQELDTVANKLAYYNRVANSASQATLNWGKNTQWAGRQLMVGFTVPLAMATAAVGKLSFTIEEELTRVKKVYDTTFNADLSPGDQEIARQKELGQVRAQSLDLATQASKRYGIAAKDTLDVEAQFAATGLKSSALTKATSEALRIATLGELDYQKSVDMTISLQSAFGISSDKLAEKFNFMNAVENATSLSIQDIAEAVPRAASAMSGLGVSVEEMVVLLTAMRERGVDAAEGANALKSATTRLLNPTAKAQELFAAMGISIKDVVTQTGGNLFKVLQVLAPKLAQVNDLQRQQGIAALFGTYQYNRLNAALSGITQAMSGVGNQTSQTSRAMEILKQDTTDWATTADSEINAIQQSASGKLKIAYQTLMTQLSTAGAPILEFAAGLLSTVAEVVDKFSNLPSGFQKFLLIVGGIVAAIGPFTMLLGLFANLAGNVGKFITTMIGLKLRFSLVTEEERKLQLAANAAKNDLTGQAASTKVLSDQMRVLTASIQEAVMAQIELDKVNKLSMISSRQQAELTSVQRGLYDVSPTAKHVIEKEDKNGKKYYTYDQSIKSDPIANGQYPKNMRATADDVAIFLNTGKETEKVLAKSRKEMEGVELAARQASTDLMKASQVTSSATASTSRMSGLWRGMVPTIATVGTGLLVFGAAEGSTNKILDTMINVGIAASFVGPSLMSGIRRSGITNTFKKIGSEFLNLGRSFGGGTKSVVSAAKGLAGAFLGSPLLLITGALVGASLVLVKLHSNMNKIKEAQQQINNSAKDWADILGYVQLETTKVMDASGKVVSDTVRMVSKLQEANPALVKSLKEARTEQELLNIAISEGLKARMSGADVSQAYQAIRTALTASGKNIDEVNDLMIQVKARINFDDSDATLKAEIENITTRFNDLMAGNKKSFSELLFNGKDLSVKSQEIAKGVAQQFWQSLTSQQGAARREFFDDFRAGMESGIQDTFNQISAANGDKFQTLGIKNVYDLLDQKKSQDLALQSGISLPESMTLQFSNKQIAQVQKFAEAQRIVLDQLADSVGITGEAKEKLRSLADLMAAMQVPTLTVADAQNKYNRELEGAAKSGITLSETAKLQRLNALRAAAGLDNASSSAQGFGNAAIGASGAARQLSGALAQVGVTGDEMVSGVRDAMTGANDVLKGLANDEFESQMSRRVKDTSGSMDAIDRKSQSIEDANEKRQRAFDDRWKKIEDANDARWKKRQESIEKSYDNRIEKIEKEIEAEKNADKKRQDIFEAEQKRIQRAADAYNRNIDFQQAINSGDVNAAAKIANDAQAASMQNALTDANDVAKAASDAKITALEKSMDAIKTEKDARLDALKKVQDAEEKAYQRKKELQSRALEDAKKSQQRMLDAERKAQQKSNKQVQDNSNKEVGIKKQMFQAELNALLSYIPRNQAELQAQIQRVEALYKKYGLSFTGMAKEWSQIINQALTANMQAAANNLRSNIAWKSIGADTAAQMLMGAFGMNLKEFESWLKTGNLPKDGFGGATKPTSKASTEAPRPGNHAGPAKAMHTGGIIGMGPIAGRTGYPANAPRFPGETDIRALAGESILNRKATRNLGPGAINALNRGTAFHSGGVVGNLGQVGAPLAGMAAIMKSAMYTAITNAAPNSSGGGISGPVDLSGLPDYSATKYKNIKLAAEQIRNANTIMGVGKRMGASNRDLVISIMTAMQESTLRNVNYGDRDSLGLFQQRPSSGWGTPKQIMDPLYSSRKFFEALLRLKRRDSMPLTAAAQAVQRSAFPNAYAKWEPIARRLQEAFVSHLPQLLNGGTTINTGLAKLHPKEMVLTKPLTEKLNQGIDRMASGGGDTYQFNINGSNLTVQEMEDVAVRTYNKVQRQKQGRVIGRG